MVASPCQLRHCQGRPCGEPVGRVVEKDGSVGLHRFDQAAPERPAGQHLGPVTEPDALPAGEQFVLSRAQYRGSLGRSLVEWPEHRQFDLHADEFGTGGGFVVAAILQEVGVDQPQGIVVGFLLKGVKETFVAKWHSNELAHRAGSVGLPVASRTPWHVWSADWR